MIGEVLKNTKSQLGRGSTAWLYMAFGILVWDTFVEEDQQMTKAFRRGVKSRKILVSAAWLVVTGHLYGILPEPADPIHQIGIILRMTREMGRDGRQDALRQTGSC
jgi:hypothetical protein